MTPLPPPHASRPAPLHETERPVLPRPLVRAMVARERHRKNGRPEEGERLLRQMVADMDAPTWELWWKWAAFWTEDGPDAQWRYNARAMEMMTGVISTQHFQLKVMAPQVLEQSLRQLLAWAEEDDARHPTNALWSLCWWLQHHRAPEHATRARGEGPRTTWHDVNPNVLTELLPRLIALDHQPVRMAVVSGWPAEVLGLTPALWGEVIDICAADFTDRNHANLSLLGAQDETEEEARRVAQQLRACGMHHPVVRLAVHIGSSCMLAALSRRTDWPVEVQRTTLASHGLPILQHIGQGPDVPVDALQALFPPSRASRPPSSGRGTQPSPPPIPPLPKDLLLIHRLATQRDGTLDPAIAPLAANALSKMTLEATARAGAGAPVPDVLFGHQWLPWLTSLDFVAALDRETIVRVLTDSPDREVRLRLASQLAALTRRTAELPLVASPAALDTTVTPGTPPRTTGTITPRALQALTPPHKATRPIAENASSPAAPPSPMTRTPRR